MARSLTGFWLGRRRYAPILELQTALLAARQREEVGDLVLLLEHTPVITLGRGAHPENVLRTPEFLAERGVEVCETGRGGDATLHAPGQLVAYPIIDLKPDRQDVRKYVRLLSDAMNDVVGRHGVDGGLIADKIGLWVDRDSHAAWPGEALAKTPEKIGAIGVRLSKWVSTHGFALNLTTDMQLFDLIVPCGIREFGVTSLETLTGLTVSPEQAHRAALDALARHLDSPVSGYQDAATCAATGLLDRIVSAASAKG